MTTQEVIGKTRALIRESLGDTVAGAVTVGSFDGIHRGHMLVLDTLVEQARLCHGRPVAITFDRHPLELIAPERAPKYLIDNDTRDSIIRQKGIKVVRLPFELIKNLTARQWIETLASTLHNPILVSGYDNRFGSDGRQLNDDELEDICREAGMKMQRGREVPGLSSTILRRMVAEGDMTGYYEATGRYYTICGPVVHGRRLGRTIGVPTANVVPPERQQLPCRGVYAGSVTIGERDYLTVINIGRRPTIGDNLKPTVEAHILDFEGDLYGRCLTLRFHHYLRDEMKFDGLPQLKEAIAHDIEQCRKLL